MSVRGAGGGGRGGTRPAAAPGGAALSGGPGAAALAARSRGRKWLSGRLGSARRGERCCEEKWRGGGQRGRAGAPGACRPQARRERPRPSRCRCRSALPVASERKPAKLGEKAAGSRWGVSSRDELRSFWFVQRRWSAQGRAALPAAEAH